ncbi:MAG: hypothetical protein NZ482_05035 [Gloeomargarita sp. SKYG98]|nr:hypothetical protein [Gloeomargarita sp. SKYG98]
MVYVGDKPEVWDLFIWATSKGRPVVVAQVDSWSGMVTIQSQGWEAQVRLGDIAPVDHAPPAALMIPPDLPKPILSDHWPEAVQAMVGILNTCRDEPAQLQEVVTEWLPQWPREQRLQVWQALPIATKQAVRAALEGKLPRSASYLDDLPEVDLPTLTETEILERFPLGSLVLAPGQSRPLPVVGVVSTFNLLMLQQPNGKPWYVHWVDAQLVVTSDHPAGRCAQFTEQFKHSALPRDVQ